MSTITYDKAIELIRSLIHQYGSQVRVAERLDISPAFLSDILAGKRAISDNVARRLGYRRVIFFEKILKSETES